MISSTLTLRIFLYCANRSRTFARPQISFHIYLSSLYFFGCEMEAFSWYKSYCTSHFSDTVYTCTRIEEIVVRLYHQQSFIVFISIFFLFQAFFFNILSLKVYDNTPAISTIRIIHRYWREYFCRDKSKRRDREEKDFLLLPINNTNQYINHRQILKKATI
jgi:hypothetical protein